VDSDTGQVVHCCLDTEPERFGTTSVVLQLEARSPVEHPLALPLPVVALDSALTMERALHFLQLLPTDCPEESNPAGIALAVPTATVAFEASEASVASRVVAARLVLVEQRMVVVLRSDPLDSPMKAHHRQCLESPMAAVALESEVAAFVVAEHELALVAAKASSAKAPAQVAATARWMRPAAAMVAAEVVVAEPASAIESRSAAALPMPEALAQPVPERSAV